MTPAQRTGASAEFGGSWTLEKLQILERYLDAYTTVMKRQKFELWYIDAFAGSGRIEIPGKEEAPFLRDDKETRGFLDGSAARAVGIQDRPFDKLIFIEKDAARCDKLQDLRGCHPDRNIHIENADANKYLAGLGSDWRGRRGVLFLDPYATQVEWATIRKIAGLKALDTWILFPTYALFRMLPTGRKPDPTCAERLTKIYGDESWQDLYEQTTDLFKKPLNQRQPGVDRLRFIYKENLRNLFGCRFLQDSRPLMNSKKSVLFEFIFCAGHPKGAHIAHDIARHLIKRL